MNNFDIKLKRSIFVIFFERKTSVYNFVWKSRKIASTIIFIYSTSGQKNYTFNGLIEEKFEKNFCRKNSIIIY